MIKNGYIIISGAAGFLGKYFSKELVKSGYSLVLIDKNMKELTYLKNLLFKNNIDCNVITFKTDISREYSVKKLFKYIKQRRIKIISIINSAAIDTKPSAKNKDNKYLSKSNWDKELAVGLTGTYLMIKYFGELMYQNGYGKIINIGSDLSLISPNQEFYKKSYKNYYKPASYSVIKHGLLGLTKYFATFYADKNITCNMISPGPVLHDQSKSLISNIKKNTPMKRLSKPQDLLGIILFFISDKSSFITGQNVLVDGGKTLI